MKSRELEKTKIFTAGEYSAKAQFVVDMMNVKEEDGKKSTVFNGEQTLFDYTLVNLGIHVTNSTSNEVPYLLRVRAQNVIQQGRNTLANFAQLVNKNEVVFIENENKVKRTSDFYQAGLNVYGNYGIMLVETTNKKDWEKVEDFEKAEVVGINEHNFMILGTEDIVDKSDNSVVGRIFVLQQVEMNPKPEKKAAPKKAAPAKSTAKRKPSTAKRKPS